ncbi:MAG: hypothetical protein QXO27_04140 [Candidatus Aenigmatarchaeota archaeon]
MQRPRSKSKHFPQTIAPQNLHEYAGFATFPHIKHKPEISII